MSGVPLSVVQVGQTYRVESEVMYKGERKIRKFVGKFKFTAGGGKFMIFERTLLGGKTQNVTVFVDKLRIFPYSAAARDAPGAADTNSFLEYSDVFLPQDEFTGSASDADKAGMAVVDEIPPPENPTKPIPCFDTLKHDFVYFSSDEIAAMHNPMYANKGDFTNNANMRWASSRARSYSNGSTTGSESSTDSLSSVDGSIAGVYSDSATPDMQNPMLSRAGPMTRKMRANNNTFSGDNPMNRDKIAKGEMNVGGARAARRGKCHKTARRRTKHRRSRRANKCCKKRASRRRG